MHLQANIANDTSSKAAADHKTEPEITRRQLFLNGAKTAFFATELALLVSPPFFLHRPSLRALTEQVKVKQGTLIHYTRTDQETVLPDGASFHNLGVYHQSKFWGYWQDLIRDRIDSSDIVLVECTKEFAKRLYAEAKIAPSRHDDFFDQVETYALSQGKRVISIDSQNPVRTAFQPYVSAGLALLGAAALASERLFAKRPFKPTSGMGRIPRAITRTLAWAGLLTSGESAPTAVARELDTPTPWDLAWGHDGRSVYMLSRVNEEVKVNPGKRILAITGDAHARDFEFYTRHPRIFACKEALYRLLYHPFFLGTRE